MDESDNLALFVLGGAAAAAVAAIVVVFITLGAVFYSLYEADSSSHAFSVLTDNSAYLSGSPSIDKEGHTDTAEGKTSKEEFLKQSAQSSSQDDEAIQAAEKLLVEKLNSSESTSSSEPDAENETSLNSSETTSYVSEDGKEFLELANSSTDEQGSKIPAPEREEQNAALDTKTEEASPSKEAEQSQPVLVGINTSIEELLQNPGMPSGCEIVSMASVLHAIGYDISARNLADDFIMKVKGEPNLVNSYSGTPYGQGGAFPPVMVRGGNDYFRSIGSQWRFVERSGISLERLLMIVETGRPVLVWTTMYMAQPSFSGDVIAGYKWYSNEHCVVLYGQTIEGKLLVMDPLDGAVERDRKAFEELYDLCGRHAVTLTAVAAESIDEKENPSINEGTE